WQRLNTTGLPAPARVRALAGVGAGTFLLNSDRGTFRSVDNGAAWQPLEGALSSGGVAEFLPWPERAKTPAAVAGRAGEPGAGAQIVFAATGYGIFISRDGGALWQPRVNGLPFNSRIAGVLATASQAEQIWVLNDTRPIPETAPPPLVLRSLDGGRTWSPAARGLPETPATAWAAAATRVAADTVIMIATRDRFFRTNDGGLSWQGVALTAGNHTAIAVAASDTRVIYLGGQPALRSTDGGESWQPMPVVKAGQDSQAGDVTGLAVDPANANHLWAGLDDGMAESTDGGRTWQGAGLDGKKARWLQSISPDGKSLILYAGVAEDGIYRLALPGGRWEAASKGLPDRSVVLSLLHDPKRPGLLWATRDGGGIYRSTDGGATWTNIAVNLGDNLAQAATLDFATTAPKNGGGDAGLLIGTANAGIWALRPPAGPAPAPPPALDARIELVWPHGGAAVSEAKRANIGFRLFARGSLEPPACSWLPRVTLWQAVNNSPAEPLEETSQRTVDGQPFPFWELNDVDVSRATDAGNSIYFMAQGDGPDLATSIWAHSADPRTFFPQQDVPSGLATGPIEAVDARIQIVWPHDASGVEQPPDEAPQANLVVMLFKRGTRLSVPVGWQPPGLTLYGAWNHEVGRPLAHEATPGVRTAGAITYPYWEFTNIPVARAMDPANRLYLWVQLDALETHPTIWAHGTDARTAFPVPDEPIRGCIP
ncbi:MAG: Sortilin-Vps10 protein, partial [Chloroflexota bacterium]|nr:Sortilin-Vps10 protein [Chloroflexota bacterium]